ncbi:uncharacterized protein [Diadema setosum]|uniref:uncharacterized protein n=1 Tax=Diadema setosum TaxID=31175 RepID=UPI003B3AB2E3
MHLTLISAYAPTMTYTLEQKELFYQNLTNVLRSVSREDNLLILGDFNARVGRDAQSWPDVIGPHDIDWFDNNKEITDWLNYKDSEAKHHRLKNIRGNVQTELLQLKEKWSENKASELQQYADDHNSKKLFAALKDVYGPQRAPMAPVPITSANGTLLTEKSDIIQHWNEHFSQLLNRPFQIDKQASQDTPQRPLLVSLDDSPPPPPEHLAETKKSIKQLQVGEAPGPVGIPSEIFNEGGEAIAIKLTELIQQFWKEGSMPQDFKEANIVHLYKNKGDRASCENRRDISLLSIAGKIMIRVVVNCITPPPPLLDNGVSEI